MTSLKLENINSNFHRGKGIKYLYPNLELFSHVDHRMTHETTTLTQEKAANSGESRNNISSSFSSYGTTKPEISGIDTPVPCMFFQKVPAGIRLRI